MGLRRGTVALEPHRAEWESSAQTVIETLRDILHGQMIDAQHIGSTAIRGICAKPIIDIAVGVRDFHDILAKNAALEAKGFLFRGQDVPQQYLYVCGGADFRTHHIHAVIYDSAEWKHYINFRDYLNSHPGDARRYAALKTALAAQFPDNRAAYTEGKAAMIAELLQKAAVWRKASSN